MDALLQVISSHKNSDEANLILERKERNMPWDVSLERLCFSKLTSQSVDLLDVFYVHRLVFYPTQRGFRVVWIMNDKNIVSQK